jgi:exo-1,4-beta-D-glucosaminidase
MPDERRFHRKHAAQATIQPPVFNQKELTPMRNKFAYFLLPLIFAPVFLQAEATIHLHDGWRLQSACALQAAGDAITGHGFKDDGWLNTNVPSTVLAAQVAAGVLPDPYIGRNLRNIPGTAYPVGQNFANLPMPVDSPYACGWWYRKVFTAPAAAADGGHFSLYFGGINYRGEVWLNGHQVGDSSTVAGAYRTYTFDVTKFIHPGAENILAVKTTAPTEKDLGINWVDWNPCPPDKEMGVWGAVDLIQTGAVTVRSPLVVTHFPGADLAVADLTIYAELHNATAATVKGVVSGTAAGIHFQKPVELAPHEDRTVVFDAKEIPELGVHNPKLWWPFQMGDPHLERVTVVFSTGGHVTDEQSAEFGIREVTSELTANGSRLFRINRKPILIRGAGWSSDLMLRPDEKRLRDQFRLVRDMRLNTIRLEGKLETDQFFHLADEQGILVMLGWCCCDHWEHWKNWTPEDLQIAKASLHSQMLRLRHHASLMVWLNGSDNPPPPDVERAYLQVEADSHWPNPTLSSATEKQTTVTGESGVKMTGPYDYVAPSYWYAALRFGGAIGFNTETSPGPAIPSLASRRIFLSDPEAWPPSGEWNLHNGGGDFVNLKVLGQAMEATYAKPASASQYERIAQTMEYDSERAMFEAYSKNKYSSTGVVQWMLNNAWPSMIWHLFDYYLDAGGGYFGAKKACEPVHIQYAYDDRSVLAVNSTYAPVTGLHATVHVHNLEWKELYSAEANVNLAADSVERITTIPESLYSSAERLFFIDLTLTSADGNTVSRNFFWVPGTLTAFDWEKSDYTHTPPARYEDLTALAGLSPAQVDSQAELESTAQGSELRVRLTNRSQVLAFQVRAAARTAAGELIAPVLWSDNWIELIPGESVTLTAALPATTTSEPVVQIEGWNVAPVTLTPKSIAAR